MEKNDMCMLISEDAEGITFITKHAWRRIRDDEIPSLSGFEIVSSVSASTGIYHIMINSNPLDHFSEKRFILAKYVVDVETGKIMIFMTDLSNDEASDLSRNMEKYIW